jgi:hypothetical protein
MDNKPVNAVLDQIAAFSSRFGVAYEVKNRAKETLVIDEIISELTEILVAAKSARKQELAIKHTPESIINSLQAELRSIKRKLKLKTSSCINAGEEIDHEVLTTLNQILSEHLNTVDDLIRS